MNGINTLNTPSSNSSNTNFDQLKNYKVNKKSQIHLGLTNSFKISENVPIISYKRFNELYQKFKPNYEDQNKFKKSLFKSKTEYESFQTKLKHIHVKYQLYNISLFTINYFIGRYFYSYFLYYFPIKRRFMYNFQFLLIPIYSLFYLNSVQDMMHVNLRSEANVNSLYGLYLWFDLNFKNETLNKENINFLDSNLENNLYFMSKTTIPYSTVKKILYYHFLKAEYIKLILAKEVIALANVDNIYIINIQVRSCKDSSYLGKFIEYSQYFIDFFTKSDDDPLLNFPILDENNWTDYLQYSDLNNLLLNLKVLNNYNNEIEKFIRLKTMTCESSSSETENNKSSLEIHNNISYKTKYFEIQNDEMKKKLYKEELQKLRNDISLLNEVDSYIYKPKKKKKL